MVENRRGALQEGAPVLIDSDLRRMTKSLTSNKVLFCCFNPSESKL